MSTIKDDLVRIEAALKAARRRAITVHQEDEYTWALEALERVREAWRERPVQR